jgi:quercetin dioxygenase-like cupin family protein
VEAWQFVDGVTLHAIGGEQILLCRVTYAPGKFVQRHAHPEAEQVMVILDGAVDVTIKDETRRLGAGDVCVMNAGVEHELHSEGGVTFFEALSPVPVDHVPDRDRDLVLGSDGASRHVDH